MITENKQDLTKDSNLSRASKEISSLDAWIEQHLEEREKRLNGNNQFVWHQPNANDLLPSTSMDITPIDLDKPINFK